MPRGDFTAFVGMLGTLREHISHCKKTIQREQCMYHLKTFVLYIIIVAPGRVIYKLLMKTTC